MIKACYSRQYTIILQSLKTNYLGIITHNQSIFKSQGKLNSKVTTIIYWCDEKC